MKYNRMMFVSLFGLLTLAGCNYVSREELTRSQADLRAEMEADTAETALAVHTCAQSIGQVQQFNMICQMFGVPAYCAAVDSYVDSCMNADENGVLSLPEPRVWERMLQAAEDAPPPAATEDEGTTDAPTDTTEQSTQPSTDSEEDVAPETEFSPTPDSVTLEGSTQTPSHRHLRRHITH